MEKVAGIMLMISSIYWIMADIYWIIQRSVGDAAQYWADNMFENVIISFMIIVPVSLLTLAIHLVSKES